MRLQPGVKSGVSWRRSHGSLTCLRRCALPNRATSPVSGVSHTSAVALASWPQNSAWRASCCVAGTFAKSSCAAPGVAMSSRGSTQPGVRWKTLTNSACLTSSGHDLDGAGAGADDGDPLAGEVVVVIPARAVDLVALVGVETADVGQLVVGQRPGRQHHGAGAVALAAVGRDRPDAVGLVELEAVDLDAELDAPAQVEVVDQVLDVTADLAGGRVGPRPGRVLRERERVQQRRDVACRTGIRVVAPGSADAVARVRR